MAYLGIGEERDPLAGIKVLLGGVVPEQWPGREGPTVLPTGGGGMVPSPVNPEAIRMFTEKMNPPGQLTGNIGNLPPGDFLRMLYNPDVTAPAAPTTTTAGPVAAPAVSPADAAAKMAGQYSGSPNLMPWDFWIKNPGVSGGMMRVNEGPKAGQTFSFFDQNKPADMMDTIRPLIQQYAEKASALLSANPEQAARMPFNMESLHSLIQGVNSLITSQQTGAKVPSEIGRNLAEAGRGQFINVPTGPGGQTGAFMTLPGEQPRQFATGTPQEKMTVEDQAINRSMSLVGTLSQVRRDKQLLGQSTEQEDFLLSKLLPPIIAKVSGGQGMVGQPQHTDQSFMAQLQQKYPGQKPAWYQDQLRKARAGSPQSFGR